MVAQAVQFYAFGFGELWANVFRLRAIRQDVHAQPRIINPVRQKTVDARRHRHSGKALESGAGSQLLA
jgi:hypothetical protein